MPQDPELFAILQGFGIPSGLFSALLRESIINDWSADELLANLYGSEAFGNMFPGIFGSEGELVMTPGEYLSSRREYQHMAATYGFDLSNQAFGEQIVAGGTSGQEFLDRLEAAARVTESPEMFESLTHFAKEAGLGAYGKEELFDALLGLAPKEFYDLWEKTSIQGMAALSGFHLGDKGVEKIQELAGERILESPQTKLAFENLAHQIKTTLPLSKIYKFGVTKGDLLQLEFGGPRQAEIAQTVQRIVDTDEAFQSSARVRGQVYPGQGGGVTAPGGQAERPQVQ